MNTATLLLALLEAPEVKRRPVAVRKPAPPLSTARLLLTLLDES